MPESVGEGLELRRVAGLDGYLLVRGRLAGRNVLVNVDTGKSHTVVDVALARDPELRPDPATGRVDLELGRWHFHPPLERQDDYADLSRRAGGTVAVSLGQDLLVGLILSVDWRAGRLWLSSPSPPPAR
jgi:hypothetical protein